MLKVRFKKQERCNEGQISDIFWPGNKFLESKRKNKLNVQFVKRYFSRIPLFFLFF